MPQKTQSKNPPFNTRSTICLLTSLVLNILKIFLSNQFLKKFWLTVCKNRPTCRPKLDEWPDETNRDLKTLDSNAQCHCSWWIRGGADRGELADPRIRWRRRKECRSSAGNFLKLINKSVYKGGIFWNLVEWQGK